MLLTIIVYIYTVIAFNFFRKFYVQEEDEEVDKKCHDMMTVIIILLDDKNKFCNHTYLNLHKNLLGNQSMTSGTKLHMNDI